MSGNSGGGGEPGGINAGGNNVGGKNAGGNSGMGNSARGDCRVNGGDDSFQVVRRGKNKNGSQEMKDSSGLNANRQRGFSSSKPNVRIPTSTLADMQAKEGSLVSKFMTFLCRKNTFVIDLYEGVYFRSKPTFDIISEFISKDLCSDQDTRKALVDVQLHPVKMLLFIKFNSEGARDKINARVQSPEGVTWTHYGVWIKGYNLDAQVKRISLLGAGPETTAEDINLTFQQLGIGEVVESRKGLLDPRRLPGVTKIKKFHHMFLEGTREKLGL